LVEKYSWLEVKALVEMELDPFKATSNAFPSTQPENSKVPPYTFYKPRGEVITNADMEFVALLEKRR
jgi:hypothetical protein